MRRNSPINRAVLWDKTGYKPHGPEQLEFHDSEARFRAPICGRRFGKSTMAAKDMTESCFIPDSYYWICGPTYKLAEKEYRQIYSDFHDKRKLNMGSKLKASYNVKQGDMKITFPWNTVLECVSATNPDSLLGEGLDGVIMSEAAEHKLETWEKYIEPALSDKLGWATFPTTPKGFNWVHGLYTLGQDPLYPDYFSQRYPSWLNTYRYPGGFDEINCFWTNPANGEKIHHHPSNCECNPELVRIWSIATPGYWGQQYAARFTNIAGSIYDEFDENIHVTDINYVPYWRNYWVFDWGFSAPFVCLDIMVDPDDNIYVWREYQQRYMTTGQHGEYLINRENPDGFHVDGRYADPASPDSIATLAPKIGPIYARHLSDYEDMSNMSEWARGIEEVKRFLKLKADGRPRLLIDRKCRDLIRQMQALRRMPEKDEKNPREGQVDYDDHGPDALRYFIVQHFLMGGGESLSDFYSGAMGSESETFFKNHTLMTLDSHV